MKHVMENTMFRPVVLLVAISICMNANAIKAQSTLFKAGKVITMDGDPLVPGMVLVVDGKISAVAGSIDAGEGVDVVDFGNDSVMMPGLVNAYSQAGLDSATSDEYSREVTPEFEILHSIDWDALPMKKTRLSGTTTACICPGRENVIAGLSAIVKTIDRGDQSVLVKKGPLSANLCSDPANRNNARRRPDSIYVRQPTNRMGVVWILRSHFDRARGDDDTVGSETLRSALDGKITTFMYSRKSHDILAVQTLAEEFNFQPVLVGGQESYLTIDELKKRKSTVVLTPVPTGLMQGSEGTDLNLNRAGILSEAGITFCLSGDDLLEQARFAVRFGLEPQQALEAITTTPAKLLGVEKRVGKIAPNMDADMIVVNGDPLQLTTAIQQVIIDGESLIEHNVANDTNNGKRESE